MPVAVQSLIDEIAALKAEFNLPTWSDAKLFFRIKIIEAGASGGVISYTIAGRTVTKSLADLTKMLEIAEARAGGGLVRQMGEF